MPYQPGDILRSAHPNRAYNAYRVTSGASPSGVYGLQVLEIRPDREPIRPVGGQTTNTEANLRAYGYTVQGNNLAQPDDFPSGEYAPGTILRPRSDRANYGGYRIVERLSSPREAYRVEVLPFPEPDPSRGGVRYRPGDRVQRTRAHLDEYGYQPEQTESDPSPREEVKMKIHTLIHNTPEVATPVSAVTMPEAALNGETLCSRRFARTAWSSHDEPTYALSADEPVLIEFSDGTLGVCAEDRLEAALAAFDLQLTTS